jgi:hypothetical protein
VPNNLKESVNNNDEEKIKKELKKIMNENL